MDITSAFTIGTVLQKRILDLNSRLLINDNEMINNHPDKWNEDIDGSTLTRKIAVFDGNDSFLCSAY